MVYYHVRKVEIYGVNIIISLFLLTHVTRTTFRSSTAIVVLQFALRLKMLCGYKFYDALIY